MAHYKEDFDDNCFELQVLRMFRDAMVSKEEVAHYYKVTPTKSTTSLSKLFFKDFNE